MVFVLFESLYKIESDTHSSYSKDDALEIFEAMTHISETVAGKLRTDSRQRVELMQNLTRYHDFKRIEVPEQLWKHEASLREITLHPHVELVRIAKESQTFRHQHIKTGVLFLVLGIVDGFPKASSARFCEGRQWKHARHNTFIPILPEKEYAFQVTDPNEMLYMVSVQQYPIIRPGKENDDIVTLLS